MSKVSVLVVDDATFIRDLVKKGLRDHFPGIQLEEAVNGRKAQQLLNRQAVDLILCDWEMPEMSGLELLSWCRGEEAHKGTPFIMVTSRGDKENVVQAIQAGVSDYIGKPFSNDQLVTKVKKALSRTGKLAQLSAALSRRSRTSIRVCRVVSKIFRLKSATESSSLIANWPKLAPAARLWASLSLRSWKPLQPMARQKRTMVGSLMPTAPARSAMELCITAAGSAST